MKKRKHTLTIAVGEQEQILRRLQNGLGAEIDPRMIESFQSMPEVQQLLDELSYEQNRVEQLRLQREHQMYGAMDDQVAEDRQDYDEQDRRMPEEPG